MLLCFGWWRLSAFVVFQVVMALISLDLSGCWLLDALYGCYVAVYSFGCFGPLGRTFAMN